MFEGGVHPLVCSVNLKYNNQKAGLERGRGCCCTQAPSMHCHCCHFDKSRAGGDHVTHAIKPFTHRRMPLIPIMHAVALITVPSIHKLVSEDMPCCAVPSHCSNYH